MAAARGLAIALPGWVDRAYATLCHGAPGRLSLELVPAGCLADPGPRRRLEERLDALVGAAGARVALRLEKGVGGGCGLSDEATAYAALAAVVRAAAGSTSGPDPLAEHLARICELTPETAAALTRGGVHGLPGGEGDHESGIAVVIADAKASSRDLGAAREAMRTAGAGEVFALAGAPTLVACCHARARPRVVMQQGLDLLAGRGIWSRGRAGPAGRGLRVGRWLPAFQP